MKQHFSVLILLVAMILCSLFIGFAVNGQWILVGGYLKSHFVMIKHGTVPLLGIVSYILLVTSHIGVILLPFFINAPYFKKLLLGLPLAFVLFYATLFFLGVLLLIPFIIFWLVCLSLVKSNS